MEDKPYQIRVQLSRLNREGDVVEGSQVTYDLIWQNGVPVLDPETLRACFAASEREIFQLIRRTWPKAELRQGYP